MRQSNELGPGERAQSIVSNGTAEQIKVLEGVVAGQEQGQQRTRSKRIHARERCNSQEGHFRRNHNNGLFPPAPHQPLFKFAIWCFFSRQTVLQSGALSLGRLLLLKTTNNKRCGASLFCMCNKIVKTPSSQNQNASFRNNLKINATCCSSPSVF